MIFLTAFKFVRLSLLVAPAVALAACGGQWPDLAGVSRPQAAAEAEELPALDDRGAAVVADGAVIPPAPAGSETAPAEGDLDALREAVRVAAETAAARYADYVNSLDRLLTSSGDGDLITRWSTAQSALSRFSMAVDSLRDLRHEAARRALRLSVDQTAVDRDRIAAANQLVAETADLADKRQDQMVRESNRLAVLTPPAFGDPAPAAVSDGGRTAFATIDFTTADPAFTETLKAAVEETRELVPGLAFDLIASGPADSVAAQQAALRRTAAVLRGLKVAPGQMAMALAAPDETVTLRIYLRKAS